MLVRSRTLGGKTFRRIIRKGVRRAPKNAPQRGGARECAKLFSTVVFGYGGHTEAMKDAHTDTGYSEDVETALLDVELFLKYKSHTRAIARLQEAIKNNPHAIKLRERLREVALANNQPEEAARIRKAAPHVQGLRWNAEASCLLPHGAQRGHRHDAHFMSVGTHRLRCDEQELVRTTHSHAG